MSAHRFHPDNRDPEGALLFDDCPGCERHAKLLLSLDVQSMGEMWDRMLDVEYREQSYRTGAEARAGRRLYEIAVFLRRYMGMNPERPLEAWRMDIEWAAEALKLDLIG